MPSPSADAGRPLDLARAFRFVTFDPDWIKKILIGGLFTLLSALLVGAPFVAGYWVRLVRNVARGEPRPLPEWDDLGGLFVLGIRALAVYLGHFLAVMLVPASAGIVIAVLMAAASQTGQRNAAAEALGFVAGVGLVGLYGLSALLMLLLTLYVPAALLRFVEHDSVKAAFQPGEVFAVIRRHLGNYLLVLVVYLVANFVSQLGVILCCVGVFPLSFWSFCILAWGLGELARRDAALSPLASLVPNR